MAVVRVIKDKSNPYVMLNKTCLHDDKLSWKAKGLHSYLLSLPDNWKIYIADLKNRSKDGKHATSNTIKELIDAGYVKRIAKRDKETNKFIGGFEYEVYEIPINIIESSPKTEKSRESENWKTGKVDNPESRESENWKTGKVDNPESRESENQPLINNKYKLNNNINSKYVSKDENNLSLISKIYQENIGPIYPANREWIIEVSERFEVDLFKRAIEICIDRSNVTQGYLKGILKKWDEEGIVTFEQLQAKEIEFKNRKAKNKTTNNTGEDKLQNNSDDEIDQELLEEMRRQEELLGLS